MEEVEVAAALGAVAVLVVIASLLVRRRASRETQSVAGYRRALDVLGQVAEGEHRPRQPGPGAPSGPGAPRSALPERPDRMAPGRLDGVLAQAPGRRSGVAPDEGSVRRDRSLLVMEHPARKLGPTLAVSVVVVAVVGGAAYLIVRSHHSTRPPTQAATTGSRGHTKTSHEPTTHKRAKRQTSTAPPSRYLASSSTGSSASYAPATSSYSLTVGASAGSCWMSVTSASGKTVLAQTFAPGASTTISLTGRSTVVLGAPKAARLEIDGAPVVLPNATGVPFTITISPA